MAQFKVVESVSFLTQLMYSVFEQLVFRKFEMFDLIWVKYISIDLNWSSPEVYSFLLTIVIV